MATQNFLSSFFKNFPTPFSTLSTRFPIFEFQMCCHMRIVCSLQEVERPSIDIAAAAVEGSQAMARLHLRVVIVERLGNQAKPGSWHIDWVYSMSSELQVAETVHYIESEEQTADPRMT